MNRIFAFENYYIVYSSLKNAVNDKEADFLPKTDNFWWKMITTNQEADELATSGFNFGAYELNLRASLDRSVLVFCIFINKEIAHIVCLAENLRGKETIDPRPFSVDFQNGEVATGRALTVPKFRRLHLRRYSGYLLRKYCLERGITRINGTMLANNYPALVAATQSKYMTIISKCRFKKMLWFKYVKVTEMDPTTLKRIVARMIANQEK